MKKDMKIIICAFFVLVTLGVFFSTEITGAWSWRPSRCTDSDKGSDYFVKGSCNDGRGIKTDVCTSDTRLREYYCSGLTTKRCKDKTYWCPDGCKDGACITTCKDITWSPDTSTVCPRDTLTQTSNCGNTRIIIGTKTCDSGYVCENGACVEEEIQVTYQGVLDMLQGCTIESSMKIYPGFTDFARAGDLDNNNVFTGDEFCKAVGKTCIFTQNIAFDAISVSSGQDRYYNASTVLKDCSNGITDYVHWNIHDNGFLAWCCSI